MLIHINELWHASEEQVCQHEKSVYLATYFLPLLWGSRTCSDPTLSHVLISALCKIDRSGCLLWSSAAEGVRLQAIIDRRTERRNTSFNIEPLSSPLWTSTNFMPMTAETHKNTSGTWVSQLPSNVLWTVINGEMEVECSGRMPFRLPTRAKLLFWC